MADHAFRILNVFAIEHDPFSGNPLCVFERGDDLSSEQMQSLARQFNLSETTFILPPSSPDATAHVRIFTPSFEMPFAGHPTLGTAHVVRDLARRSDGASAARRGAHENVRLEMIAGVVEVSAAGDKWTLRAARAPESREPAATRKEIAAMLRLPEAALDGAPLWIDTGVDQLVIPLANADAVKAARPDGELLARHATSAKRPTSMAYVWARTAANEVLARFFFLTGSGVVEDPATGSACANLGGYLLTTGQAPPARLRVSQGSAVRRPSLLELEVGEDGSIRVGGLVTEMGRGSIVAL